MPFFDQTRDLLPILFNQSGGTHEGISLDFTKNRFYIRVPGQPARVGAFTDLFTFTRAAPDATFRGPNGLIQTATTNIPRIEYSTTGSLLGLLIEGSRTNGLLQSRDQTQAAWVKTTMTAAQDQVGADGVTNSASSLLATGANATSLQTIVQAAVSSTLSFDIKRLIGTGTIGICQDGATFTDVTAQINATGYTRVTLTASQLNPVLGIQLGSNGDKIAVDFGQFEAGAFVSSRIPTTAGSVTRAADSPTRVLGSEFSSVASTLYVESDTANPTAARPFVMDDGSAAERLLVYAAAAVGTGRIVHSSANEMIVTTGTVTANVIYKQAMAAAANDGAYTMTGGTLQTDATIVMPTGINRLALGFDPAFAGQEIFGHIRRLEYWPIRQPNAFLQQNTT